MIGFKKFVISGILILIMMSGCIEPVEEKQPVQKIPQVQLTNSSELTQPLQGTQVTNLSEVTQSEQKLPKVQVINMSVDSMGWWPDTFILQKGVKVKWIITAWDLTKCNREIIVKDYGLDIKLNRGENIVEFTPDRKGTIGWSCWMNMINGTFIVVNDPMNMSEVENAMPKT